MRPCVPYFMQKKMKKLSELFDTLLNLKTVFAIMQFLQEFNKYKNMSHINCFD